MTLPGELAPYFWPILGLGVGMALTVRRRYWPWLIAILVAIDIPYLDRDAYNFSSPLGFAIEYATYYVVVFSGCWILRNRYPEGLNLARLNYDLRDFLIAAAAIAATTGVLEPVFSALAGEGQLDWRDWYHWFALDLMSILVVAPFIFAWTADWPGRRSLKNHKSIVELGALLGATFVVFWFELFGPPGEDKAGFDFVWALVLWGIFRFDLRIVTSIILFTTSYVSAKTNLSPGDLEYLADFWQDQSLILTTYVCVATSIALIINALLGYARDKRAEVNQAREYLDALIQKTGSFLWVYNVADRKYDYFSDTDTGQWTDNIGMRDVPGQIFNYLHSGDDQTAKPLWNRILNGEQMEPFNFAYRLINKDGNVRWDRNIGIPLPGDDGSIERYVGMILDITDEQELRAERLRLHDVIRESDKLHAIGTLSTGLAHDWNNLLLVLSMEASRVEDLADKQPELGTTIDTLNQIVVEGRGITDELMSLARREREPTTICNLYEEVNNGAELLARAVPSNISVKADFDSDASAMVRCKVTHVIQIILNLGLNARDAIGTDRGTVTIRVDGPHAGMIGDRQRSVATLQVTDDGAGIPAEAIDRILEPLFTTKAERGGTGLGLSVIAGFVKEMDGEISIESEEGTGTTITVVLPVVPVSVAGS